MDKIKFKKHYKKWSKIASLWRLFSKPGRPSREDIRNYEQLLKIAIKGLKNPTIVVYGSTPEIRNMLYKYSQRQGAKVLCLEMTRPMFIAMGDFIKKKNPREKFIQGNWIEASRAIKPGSVDVCIGDYVIDNVGSHEDEFLSETSKILNTGSCFITRDYHRCKGRKTKGFREELKRQAAAVDKGELSVRQAAGFFANNILDDSLYISGGDKASYIFYEKEVADLENEISRISATEKKVFKWFLKSWWLCSDKYWTFPLKENTERIIKKYFKIEKELHSSDYEFTDCSPIYLLRKK